ncbi:MAG: asparagine--tRNA ligase [Deltaproteobacteria bacterium]|nr:asparagine--tRNA ligase [Deltaproteobacteria bacterium]
MKGVYIEDIERHVGQEVTLRGWLYNKRSSGKIHFLQVRDGTGVIQAVVSKNDVSPEVFALSDRLTRESSVVVRGLVRQDPRSPLGYEIGVVDLEAVQIAEDFPIAPKEHGVGFLLDHRHLWIRSPRQNAILRIRQEIVRACRDFLDSRGFVLVDAPIFTPAACEGTTTLFETKYFDESAYLTQSGQLYNEAAAMAFGRVYCFGPTFRAEKSKTRRHLMEFWMVEPEVAYADLDDIMELAEDFVVAIVKRVVRKREKELKLLDRDIGKLEMVEKPFPRLSYGEAIQVLKERGLKVEWGRDFGAEEETELSKAFAKPLLVHRYPVQCKAFYMKGDPQDDRLALCVDMLAPEGYGEIIGGGQREEDLGRLEEKMNSHNLPVEPFAWYLDLRRYGTVSHSGFGLGIERSVAWICGLDHVRETIPFPRMLYRLYP